MSCVRCKELECRLAASIESLDTLEAKVLEQEIEKLRSDVQIKRLLVKGENLSRQAQEREHETADFLQESETRQRKACSAASRAHVKHDREILRDTAALLEALQSSEATHKSLAIQRSANEAKIARLERQLKNLTKFIVQDRPQEAWGSSIVVKRKRASTDPKDIQGSVVNEKQDAQPMKSLDCALSAASEPANNLAHELQLAQLIDSSLDSAECLITNCSPADATPDTRPATTSREAQMSNKEHPITPFISDSKLLDDFAEGIQHQQTYGLIAAVATLEGPLDSDKGSCSGINDQILSKRIATNHMIPDITIHPPSPRKNPNSRLETTCKPMPLALKENSQVLCIAMEPSRDADVVAVSPESDMFAADPLNIPRSSRNTRTLAKFPLPPSNSDTVDHKSLAAEVRADTLNYDAPSFGTKKSSQACNHTISSDRSIYSGSDDESARKSSVESVNTSCISENTGKIDKAQPKGISRLGLAAPIPTRTSSRDSRASGIEKIKAVRPKEDIIESLTTSFIRKVRSDTKFDSPHVDTCIPCLPTATQVSKRNSSLDQSMSKQTTCHSTCLRENINISNPYLYLPYSSLSNSSAFHMPVPHFEIASDSFEAAEGPSIPFPVTVPSVSPETRGLPHTKAERFRRRKRKDVSSKQLSSTVRKPLQRRTGNDASSDSQCIKHIDLENMPTQVLTLEAFISKERATKMRSHHQAPMQGTPNEIFSAFTQDLHCNQVNAEDQAPSRYMLHLNADFDAPIDLPSDTFFCQATTCYPAKDIDG